MKHRLIKIISGELITINYLISRKKIGIVKFTYSGNILWLEVEKQYCGKKIAIYLMRNAIKEIKKKHPKKKYVYLDDMSSKSWQYNNIYKKIGFIYINEYPYPEMKGNIKHILKLSNFLLIDF